MLQYFKGKLSSLLSVLNWKGVLLIKDNMKKKLVQTQCPINSLCENLHKVINVCLIEPSYM